MFVCIINTSINERRVPKAVMFSDVVACLKHFVDMKTEQCCFTNSPNHKARSACLQRNHSEKLQCPAPSPNTPGFILSASALREFQSEMQRERERKNQQECKLKTKRVSRDKRGRHCFRLRMECH